MRVFNTRPQHQNRSWTDSLRKAGHDVVELPLLDIIPLESREQKQAIKNCILELDRFHALIFISQNAVDHALNWIEDFWPQLPVQQHCYAIGKKTEAHLRERLAKSYGLKPSDDQAASSIERTLASSDGMAMNSEALLELPALKDVTGQKILLCKGRGGRDHLQKVLSERGADVVACELYERRCPENAETLLREYTPNSDTDVFTVFSGETLSYLDDCLAKVGFANKAKLATLVPGERVAQLARQSGFGRVIVAENAGEDAMFNALQNGIAGR